jgi:hypothetical protein
MRQLYAEGQTQQADELLDQYIGQPLEPADTDSNSDSE